MSNISLASEASAAREASDERGWQEEVGCKWVYIIGLCQGVQARYMPEAFSRGPEVG